MKYWRIHYGCGCGNHTDFIIADTEELANREAYERAVEDYYSYEGYHGIQTVEEIAEEMFPEAEGWESLSKEQQDEAYDVYHETIEYSIDYWVEEISQESYYWGWEADECVTIDKGSITVDKEYLKQELQGLELQVRQETAKEILQIIKSEYGYIGDLERIIAIQYGVEVNEQHEK